ncbi:carboxypeptidase D-like [Sycon ciliatum]|uniref:carboxypeptidase D-like n=1 Tax=Sycon ciliatum TaxID=27933 RepID=UPI0031F67024
MESRVHGPLFAMNSPLVAIRSLLALVAPLLLRLIVNRDSTTTLAETDLAWDSFGAPYDWTTYHNYTALEDTVALLVADYPHLCRSYSIGKSVQGRDLLAVELSSHGLGEVDDGRPHVKYVGNVHGNDAVGRELLLRLVQHMLVNSANTSTPSIKRLLSETHVHVLPSLNPDGFEVSTEGDCQGASGRHNANGRDLNQNFPDRFNHVPPVEPETQAVINWMKSTPFTLSASFGGGQLVVKYPYDSTPSGERGYASTGDDAVFRWLSMAYALAHPTMHLGHATCSPHDNSSFPSGITNGAQWLVVNGSMQDYNYVFGNCFEVSVDLGCCRYPVGAQLPLLWESNKGALLALLATVFQNAHGRMVSAEAGRLLSNANITVVGASPVHATVPTVNGSFWRLLNAGDHTLKFSAAGHASLTRTLRIVEGVPVDLGAITLPVMAATTTPPSTTTASAATTNTPAAITTTPIVTTTTPAVTTTTPAATATTPAATTATPTATTTTPSATTTTPSATTTTPAATTSTPAATTKTTSQPTSASSVPASSATTTATRIRPSSSHSTPSAPLTQNNTVTTTYLPPKSRTLSAGGIAGILVAAAVVAGFVFVVMVNLRRFTIKRRAYSKLGGGNQVTKQRVMYSHLDIPPEHVGRLY